MKGEEKKNNKTIDRYIFAKRRGDEKRKQISIRIHRENRSSIDISILIVVHFYSFYILFFFFFSFNFFILKRSREYKRFFCLPLYEKSLYTTLLLAAFFFLFFPSFFNIPFIFAYIPI